MNTNHRIFMLMVVLGAGASYDSSTDYAASELGRIRDFTRPPRASELFGLRNIFTPAAEKISKCLLIMPELRKLGQGISVEQKLEQLSENASGYPEGRKQLVAIQFYLQWIIRDCQTAWNTEIGSQTTYRALLGQIHRQLKSDPVCFVTFNYDTLLEEAFRSLSSDISFGSIDDYVSRSDYKVIKLHGSTSWARELSGSNPITNHDHVQLANILIESADKLEPLVFDNYHVIPEDYGRGHVTSFMAIPGKPDQQAVLPAIAIPVEKKRGFVCPATHIKTLEECISRTDKLLIVGWKAEEVNFLKLLAERLPKDILKMIVSSSEKSAEEIRLKLEEGGIEPKRWLTGGGFTDQVLSGRIEKFVGAAPSARSSEKIFP